MQRQEVTISGDRAYAGLRKEPRGNGARLLSALVLWIALAAPLHLAWEWAHAPLYTLWVERSRTAVTYSIAHCTAGTRSSQAFPTSRVPPVAAWRIGRRPLRLAAWRRRS